MPTLAVNLCLQYFVKGILTIRKYKGALKCFYFRSQCNYLRGFGLSE